MADGRVRTSQSGCTAANRAFPATFSSDSGVPILRYRRLLTGRAGLTARVLQLRRVFDVQRIGVNRTAFEFERLFPPR